MNIKKYTVPDIHHQIDVSLLKNKPIAIAISPDEYVHLTAALGPILDDPRILLIGNSKINKHCIKGFDNIYIQLTNKLSHLYTNNLKGIKIFLFVSGQTEAEYYHVLTKKKIFKHSKYKEIKDSLGLAEYTQVDSVETINQFCVKGGIIDVYSPLYSNPVRLCLYDEDRSIRFYNLTSGLSWGKELDFIYLNEHKKQVKLFKFQNWIKKERFPSKPENSLLFKNISIIDYYSLLKKEDNHKTIYSDQIYFSGYKYNNKIIAPIAYKNQDVPMPSITSAALEAGDYVCHEDFGVGILKGFVAEHKKYQEESIKIQYEDGQILLSIRKLHKISIVSRETSSSIKMNLLGKPGRWERTKRSISSSIQTHVEELVKLYQNKESVYRDPFVCVAELEGDFIKSFQHVDTIDQRKVWLEIKKDLEKDSPMYRLLCGDVGFGKTEIAMRAIFRVVLNNKQAIVLVPTSVLALQHQRVFNARMGVFGVKTEVLNSSLSKKDKIKIKELWLGGKIDVLITTTAVVYDIDFIKVSSFFVVDEEHRFGVKDKEVVLNNFTNKDVLFMSATPIPRSLNLSLSGIQSISTLSSPPVLRLPIQTFMVYFDEQVIKRAIDFELSRGGQVFYVHNEIATLLSIERFLQKICPYVSIEIAHSKVSHKELNGRISRFVRGQTQLLLCTSIIGSGVDIPNANTIIINRAHRFGLAQLHQIRGRVGRGKKQGFAYLMVSQGTKITLKGEKRLQTIAKYTSLGSGYYIAKSDMNIRGGGTVFGYKQSGKAFDLGYDYYSKLVAQQISKKTKNNFVFYVDKFVYNVSFSCFFPDEYIPSSNDRLSSYKQLAGFYEIKKIQQYFKDLINIYGPPALAAKNLINMRMVSVYAGFLKILSLSCKKNVLIIVFDDKFKETSALFGLLKNKKLEDSIDKYFFAVLKNATSLELVINKAVILDGTYIKGLVERLYNDIKN